MSEESFMELQRAIQQQGFTWRAGPTSVSGLPAEDQRRRLGLRLEPDQMARIATMMSEPPARIVEFPSAWDWRSVDGADWTTAIRDQKACGSCVAFGTVAVLEAMLKRHHGNAALQPDLSEAHLFFCGCGACCDRGWWPTYALDYARDSGVPEEACFPYQDRNLPCSDSCADWANQAVKAASWTEIVDAGERKEWLATKGPMVGCMRVYRDFFSYVDGVYRHSTGELAGYHAIGVVGYSEEEQAWICKNSWGTKWGQAGWFKIGYGECGIDTEFAMYGIEQVILANPVPPEPPPPEGGCNFLGRLGSAIRSLWG